MAGVFTVALFAAGMLALLYIFWPMIGAKSVDTREPSNLRYLTKGDALAQVGRA
jgi:hypothetical protein